MSPLLLVLTVWALLSVLVVAGLCLLLHARSAFNRAPYVGTDQDHASGAGAHVTI
jgi:hypothetical protein